jgi:hypothetical protein
MDARHKHIVNEYVQACAKGNGHIPVPKLILAMHGVLKRHRTLGTPLQMPAAVADAYIDATTHYEHECEECGYRLPAKYFQSCPLCGGRVDWHLWSVKQNRIRQKHEIRPEKAN